MLITFRRKFFVRIAEIYFCDNCNEVSVPADVAIYLQAGSFTEGCSKFSTLHMDLTRSAEELLSELHEHTRIEICKKDNKDRFLHTISDSPEKKEIEAFAEYYDSFAATKGIRRCNTDKLFTLKENKGLSISRICDAAGDTICSMAYIVDGTRARGLYSASLYRTPENHDNRNKIGRAHKYQQWLDILYFKEKGFSIYDFGGLTLDEGRGDMKGIDTYKLRFGGSVVTEYNMCKPLSVKGKLAAAIHDMRR